MKKLVSTELMQKLDKFVVDEYKIKPITLMENAGKAVYDKILEVEGELKDKKITIICGKGNNGGDGLIVAENLIENGVTPTVYVLAKKTALTGEMKKIITKISKKLKINFISKYKEDIFNDIDIIVDAILGTGFNANPEGLFFDIMKNINESSAKVYSVDIPSGIHGTTGNAEDICVNADYTITMAYAKIGLYINDGYNSSGEVSVADIGFPKEVEDEIIETCLLSEEKDIKNLFKKRYLTCDKKEFGKVFNFAGSLSMPGAAILSSTAALRTGTGLLKLGIPMNISAVVSTIHPEIMTLPLAYTQPGYVSVNAEKDVLKGIKWGDALLAGPGLHVHPETKKIARRFFQKIEGKPTVLDADALNIIAETPDALENLFENTILTPHNSEMSRLVGISKELLILERLEILAKKSLEWGCHIVLKGTPTLIAKPDGTIYIHINKNPGMAVGGMGDVLSGIIVSLLGQKYEPFDAINLALNIQSVAAKFALEKYGEVSMLPSDLIKEIPNAIKYIKNL